MALATGTALTLGALGLQGAGMGYNAYQQNKAANRQNQRQDQLLSQAAGMRQGGMSEVERMLLGLTGAGGQPGFNPTQLNLDSILSQGGYNIGQDALMQQLRATPDSNLNKSLNSILSGGGNPFDTSGMFDALGAVDQRNTNQQVAGLRAGSSGLGARFGSAQLGAETALRQNISSDINARNAGIQQGSYESAQGRMLQAASQLAARDQYATGIANTLRQGGLDLASLFMQNNNANNATGMQAASMNQNYQAQILQMLLGAEQNRNAFNLQTLGLGMGMQPMMPNYGYGNAAADMGQLLMFYQLLNQRPTTGGATSGGR